MDLSFLSPGERYPNKRDHDTSPLPPARRRGQSLPRVARDPGRVALVDMALSRLTFPDIMEPLMPYEQAAQPCVMRRSPRFSPSSPENARLATPELESKGFVVASVRFVRIVRKSVLSELVAKHAVGRSIER